MRRERSISRYISSSCCGSQPLVGLFDRGRWLALHDFRRHSRSLDEDTGRSGEMPAAPPRAYCKRNRGRQPAAAACPANRYTVSKMIRDQATDSRRTDKTPALGPGRHAGGQRTGPGPLHQRHAAPPERARAARRGGRQLRWRRRAHAGAPRPGRSRRTRPSCKPRWNTSCSTIASTSWTTPTSIPACWRRWRRSASAAT